jgi:hypothetical protein
LIEGRVIHDCRKFISSGENIIRFLGDYIAKHIRQNSSLQEGQSLYLAGLFSNPFETKAHLCFSYLENNVLKGQERQYLGISQRCDLERGCMI